MTFNLQRVLESKRALRRNLAARPVAEKLRMLDALRERALTLRGATPMPGPVGRVAEAHAVYRTGAKADPRKAK